MILRSNLIFAAIILFVCPAISFSCNGNPQEPVEDFTPVIAFPNLRFDLPVFLTHCGDGSNRVFVVELDGIIKVFSNSESANQAAIFLNIDGRVTSGDEMGLLGLAFHLDYGSNGFFYVNYTTDQNGPRRTVISRFSVQAGNTNAADPNSELILLEFNQPFPNHNGGMIQFGPDGYLYIATGDGGSGGDPNNNAQNRTNLLGKILRIDVDNPGGNRNYGIPPDNPYAGNTQNFREEIFAYGLRNPWRFSIDFPSGQIWAGDVGQDAREEVDLIEKGNNYGWRIMEGNLCFSPSSNCNRTGLTLPVIDYDRSLGFSVTGGFIYRGGIKPSLQGAYIYADYGSGRIWKLRYENGTVTENEELVGPGFHISSFGVDESDELYILEYPDNGTGAIYRFSDNPTVVNDDETSMPDDIALEPNFPNPFNPMTTIRYVVSKFEKVQLTIFNSVGQKIRLLVNEDQRPGEYQTAWDAKDDRGQAVASGVYLCQLKVGEAIFVRSMSLVR